MSYVHVPESRRRELDAKAHRAIFVGNPHGVKGYKLYDLEEKKFIVSRDVQFFEENFDHFHEKAKSEDASQADLRSIFPNMNQENESVPVPLLPEAPQVQESVEPVVQENVKPQVQESVEPVVQENVKPPVQENVEPAPVQNVECPSPQNVETVGAPPRDRVNEEELVRRTYEDAFMEEV